MTRSRVSTLNPMSFPQYQMSAAALSGQFAHWLGVDPLTDAQPIAQ